MSIYFDKARELGRLILESEESIRLSDATDIFQQDEEAKQKMEEYKAYQAQVQQGMENGSLSTEQIKTASARLAQMAGALKQDPIVGALIFAENEFNSFVNRVMSVLKLTITGDACDEGDCGGCAGCGHTHA